MHARRATRAALSPAPLLSSFLSLFLTLSLSTLLLGQAAPARAAESAAPDTARSNSSGAVESRAIDEQSLGQKWRAAYWRGRTCTSASCRSPRPSGLAEVASFGCAAFGGVWFSRRRGPNRP